MSELLGDLSDEDLAFRDEVRGFLQEALTDEMRAAARFTMWVISEFEYGKRWQRALYERGWGTPMWPEEHGGLGWTPVQQIIWNVESVMAGAPSIMNMGRDLCAPCIMEFGTDEQKAEFLPAIARGDDWWAQGFSEPDVGSDLAALQLSAAIDGDEFVLNGSKIWTSHAEHSNRIFLLVRSGSGERKQQGISFLLADMDSPGIEVRPIETIAGDDEFCQVFFTDVRVPRSRVLGAENDGWSVVRYLLSYEHGGLIARSASFTQKFRWLREIAELETDGRGRSLLEDPDFSRQLAELAIEVQAASAADDQLKLLARDGSRRPALPEGGPRRRLGGRGGRPGPRADADALLPGPAGRDDRRRDERGEAQQRRTPDPGDQAVELNLIAEVRRRGSRLARDPRQASRLSCPTRWGRGEPRRDRHGPFDPHLRPSGKAGSARGPAPAPGVARAGRDASRDSDAVRPPG